uniref:Uncharacterized protein n=1 Tax=Octopus bimaculoides TaxID=37653 RepID=A0A0L8HHD7_OCTBM
MLKPFAFLRMLDFMFLSAFYVINSSPNFFLKYEKNADKNLKINTFPFILVISNSRL